MPNFTNKKVVVPIDFGGQSQDALDAALELVTPASNIHVLHVASDLSTVAPELVWQEETDDTRRKNITENFLRQFDDPQYRTLNFAVRFGDPGQEIVDYVAELQADMIIMPSHGRSGISRLLLGSVTERVLRLAHCPVLVLKKQESEPAHHTA